MINNYEKAVELLTSQGKFYINLGLERIALILDLLGNPQDKLKCIHVAGTNGKGSVCAMIAAVLETASIKTGLYTSPHILSIQNALKLTVQKFLKKILQIIFLIYVKLPIRIVFTLQNLKFLLP